MHFDLTDLGLFRHVVEAGSITKGAERAHLALAAASTRIRNLERSLGAPLLLRSRGGVVPTPAGRTLLGHARAMLAGADRLREDLAAYAGGLAGEIRVLSNTNALTEFLPEALAAFLARHPQVSVALEERLSDEIVGLVAEGVGDIGIVAGTVDTGRLATFPFRQDRFVVVVAAAHPLAGRAALPFAEVLEHDFVGLDRASALQRFLVRQGRPHRPPPAPARAAAQLRRRLPPGGIGRRPRHRPRDHRPPRCPGQRHRDRRPGGFLGSARPHHLRASLERAADLGPAAGGAFAKLTGKAGRRCHAVSRPRQLGTEAGRTRVGITGPGPGRTVRRPGR